MLSCRLEALEAAADEAAEREDAQFTETAALQQNITAGTDREEALKAQLKVTCHLARYLAM